MASANNGYGSEYHQVPRNPASPTPPRCFIDTSRGAVSHLRTGRAALAPGHPFSLPRPKLLIPECQQLTPFFWPAVVAGGLQEVAKPQPPMAPGLCAATTRLEHRTANSWQLFQLVWEGDTGPCQPNRAPLGGAPSQPGTGGTLHRASSTSPQELRTEVGTCKTLLTQGPLIPPGLG